MVAASFLPGSIAAIGSRGSDHRARHFSQKIIAVTLPFCAAAKRNPAI